MMKVWCDVMRYIQSDLGKLFRIMYMACLGLFAGWSPFSFHGRSYGQLPFFAWALPALLPPDDLHGLPKWEAPDRWMVTFSYGDYHAEQKRSMMPSDVTWKMLDF